MTSFFISTINFNLGYGYADGGLGGLGGGTGTIEDDLRSLRAQLDLISRRLGEGK